jgi:hypothetical protein
LGSDSQVTVPSASRTKYLYAMTVPAASLMVTLHSGLADVYPVAAKATPSLVSQLPRAAMFPVILTVSPKVVVFSSLNVTATVAAGVQAVLVGDAVEVVVVTCVVVVVFPVEVGAGDPVPLRHNRVRRLNAHTQENSPSILLPLRPILGVLTLCNSFLAQQLS